MVGGKNENRLYLYLTLEESLSHKNIKEEIGGTQKLESSVRGTSSEESPWRKRTIKANPESG